MLKKILLSNFQNKMSKVAIVGALLSVLNSSNIWASNQDDFITTKLPKTILSEIFSYLSISDLGKVAQVCKKFDAVSKNDVIWKDIIPNQNINTKEDCKVFNFGFQIIEKEMDYFGNKCKAVELHYNGEEQFQGIWGGDRTNHGTMSMECTPIYNKLFITDEMEHEITYYNSPSSSDWTENNIIHTYKTKKKK